MEAKVVTTKEELDSAVKAGVKKIIVRGELAQKLKTAYQIKKYSKVTIAALGSALATIPITGGLSISVVAPIAIATGVKIGVIIGIAFIGLALILAIIENYDVQIRLKNQLGEVEIELNKKH